MNGEGMRAIVFSVVLLLSCNACVSPGAASRVATDNAAWNRERELLQQTLDLRAENAELRRHLTAQSEELTRVRVDAASCRAELNGCGTRLTESSAAANAVLDEMRARCDTIASQSEAMRAQAIRDGQLTMLESIEITGTPSRVDGFFTDDYYYTFQVRVRGKTFVLQKVRTEQEATMFARTLSSIGEIVSLLGLRK